MKQVDVVQADYINGFELSLKFSDGKIQNVDFSKFLNKHHHPQFDKYKQINNFKLYKIEMGNVVWGENWDLIFPIEQLYKGKISV